MSRGRAHRLGSSRTPTPSGSTDAIRKQDLEARVPVIRYPAVDATAARPSGIASGEFYLRRPATT